MAKRATTAEIPADNDRCERNDGRRWRCSLPRFGGSRFCEKHHAYFLKKNADARSASRVRAGNLDPPIKKAKVRMEDIGSVKKTRGIGVRVSDPNNGVRVSCSSRKMRKAKIEPQFEKLENSEMSKGRGGGKAVARVLGKKRSRHGKSPETKNVDGIDRNRSSVGVMRDEEKRVVRVIELGQIWAFSKEANGYPRCYARIDRIFPIPPVVRATPLIFHPVSQEEMFLSEQGFSLACGIYKLSEASCIKEISAFTHQVVADMEGKTGCFYKVYPKKGDIWAIYIKLDETRKTFEYKLVEIVTDFSEADGVDVFGLIKVEGTNNQVYKRQEYQGFYLVRGFKRESMTMFSHQIPATRVVEGGEVLWKLH